jgi:hypothetical protein
MGVHVDETGREREPVAGDAFARIAVGKISDRDDLPVGDGDVRGVWRPAQAVVDPRALEDRPEQRLT